MAKSRTLDQPDLFAAAASEDGVARQNERIPLDFIERIRNELQAMLARVRAAEMLPWPDLTKTYLAELRFESICRWLPAEEAEALKEAFGVEMERLYHAMGEERPERAVLAD